MAIWNGDLEWRLKFATLYDAIWIGHQIHLAPDFVGTNCRVLFSELPPTQDRWRYRCKSSKTPGRCNA